MAKFQKDSLYLITFYDHSIGIKDAMVCKLAGWVVEENDVRVLISPWVVISDDKEVVNNNHEYFSILKACIKTKRKFNG